MTEDKQEPLWKEEFNHRAAILEFDAGFPRDEAEQEARYWTLMERAIWRKNNAKLPDQE